MKSVIQMQLEEGDLHSYISYFNDFLQYQFNKSEITSFVSWNIVPFN